MRRKQHGVAGLNRFCDEVVYQRPLELGAMPGVDPEAGPAEIHAAREIYQLQPLRKFPVWN